MDFDKTISALKELIIYLEENKKQEKSVVDPDTFKKVLTKSVWTKAVPDYLIGNQNRNNFSNAVAILDLLVDQSLSGKKFLHFMCRDGEVNYAAMDQDPKVSVGYHPTKGNWSRFYEDNQLIFTTNIDDLHDFGKFDAILIYDVLDHDKNPVKTLKSVSAFLSENGTIFVRCHPYCARHSTHNWSVFNKAYCQFFMSEQELKNLGCDIPIQKVLYPTETYTKWFNDAGLTIRREKVVSSPLEKFLQTPVIKNKIMEIYQTNIFPEYEVSTQFVDYSLRIKNDF